MKPTTAMPTPKTTPAPTTVLETIPEEDMETEEAILERQVELSRPTAAKKLAQEKLKEKQHLEANTERQDDQQPTALHKLTTPHLTTTTTTKTTEKWQPTKTRQTSSPKEPDRSCWLYIYNNVTRDI